MRSVNTILKETIWYINPNLLDEAAGKSFQLTSMTASWLDMSPKFHIRLTRHHRELFISRVTPEISKFGDREVNEVKHTP